MRLVPPKQPAGGAWFYEALEVVPGNGAPDRVGSPVAVYPDFLDPVEFGARVYPRHLLTTWTRDDGLEVTIKVRTDEEKGPIVVGFRIDHEQGLETTNDYRPPVPSMAKQAVTGYGFAFSVKPHRQNLTQQQFRQERLAVVAKAYRQAIEDELPVTKEVRRALSEANFAVGSRSRVSALIHEARKEGLLPPTKSGRKHA